MIATRLIPFIIIGVGYLICKAILTKYPLNKDTLSNNDNRVSVLFFWVVSLLVVSGQIFYVVRIFSRLFQISGNLAIPLFIIIISVFSIYAIFFLRKR